VHFLASKKFLFINWLHLHSNMNPIFEKVMSNIATRIYKECPAVVQIINEEVLGIMKTIGGAVASNEGAQNSSNYVDLTEKPMLVEEMARQFNNEVHKPFEQSQNYAAIAYNNTVPEEMNQKISKEESNCGPSFFDKVWNFFCGLVQSISSWFKPSSASAPRSAQQFNAASADAQEPKQIVVTKTHIHLAGAAITSIVAFSFVKQFYHQLPNMNWDKFMECVVGYMKSFVTLQL